jgi:hypothetical protein
MLKKEFKEVFKQSLFFVVFVIVFPILASLLSLVFKWSLTYNDIFFPVYQVGMFIFAVVTGLTLFSAEKRQGGMEYLLTLPLSRLRLLGLKVLPRFVALGAFLTLFWLLLQLQATSGNGKSVESLLILPTLYLAYLVFWAFIISVSLSAFHDNIILLAFGILFIFAVHSLFIAKVQDILWQVFGQYLEMSFLLFAVLSIFGFLIPFAIPFVLAFRKFDLHPAGRFNRHYLKVFVPLLIICLFISAFFVYSGVAYGYDYKLYYLTSNHKLIEYAWKTTYLYDRDGRKELPFGGAYPWMCLNKCECGGWVYLISDSQYELRYTRFNIADNSLENLYTLKRPSYYSWRYWFYKDRLVFFEGSYAEENIMLVVVNVDTKAAIKIKLPVPLQEKYRTMKVIGAVEDNGKRSWLVYGEKASKGPLYRVWEDGSSQDLGLKGRSPHYINGILISQEKDGMVFSRLTAAGCEIIKIDPQGKSVKFGQFDRMDLDNSQQKEVFGLRYGEQKVLRKVDLEKFEVTKVKEFPERPIYLSQQECIVLEGYPNAGKLYRILGNGQIELLKTFSGFNVQKKGNFLRHCVNGIITRENGKVSVYAFPGMEEIPFKELN